jgi:hypothetical protein
MPCDFGRNITIDFNHLQKAVLACDVIDMLICKFALRVPVGTKIDERMGILISKEMSIQFFEAGKTTKIRVAKFGCDSEHRKDCIK